MVSRRKIVGFLVVTFIVLVQTTVQLNAYDDIQGIEENDVVDITFFRFINGVPNSAGYEDDANPFRLTVNPDYFNINLVNAVLGMKVGEVKPSIEWTVDEGDGTFTDYEYVDTKIIRLVKDATPSITPIGQIFLTIFEVIIGIGVIIGVVFLYIKVIRPRLLSRKCVTCGNQATSKCAKCGSFLCVECSVKGCPSCGSLKYIRL